MIDYSKGKIHIVQFNDSDAVYIGSTTMELLNRFQKHKYQSHCSLFKYVKSHHNGDWSKCNIELLQNAECRCRNELETLEGAKITELMNSNNYIIINKSIAGRTLEEYYKDNIAKYKKYYDNNIAKIRKYYKDNAELKKASQRAYDAKINI